MLMKLKLSLNFLISQQIGMRMLPWLQNTIFNMFIHSALLLLNGAIVIVQCSKYELRNVTHPG